MTPLEAWLKQKNLMARLFKTKEYNLRFMTYADVKELLEIVEGDLSPENVSCDGMINGSALRDKVFFLEEVKIKLECIRDEVRAEL